jgi:thioredoxin reductase (NADPH)
MIHDVAIIGGGPAGLHAALKSALLYRTAVLFDKGRKHSRIFWSPKVDNLPGRYGMAGRDVIKSGHEDIATYEADVGRKFVTTHENTTVTGVERLENGHFKLIAEGKNGSVETEARTLILATGTIDSQPQLGDFRKRDIEAVLPYANKALADYCLLCDGHTVEGKTVAVIGCSPGVRGIAKSLKKNFGANTELVPMCNAQSHESGIRDPKAEWEEVEADLAKWEIPIHYGGVKEFTGIKDGQFGIIFEDGTEKRFDKAWISMGWYKVNNEHAKMLGAKLDDDGFVVTTPEGRAMDEAGITIPRLYAIGDLRSDSWKQIPIAWGEAEGAVVDAFIHNSKV